MRPNRASLRLRVMAGVVAVTLIALAAFDYAAVTTMRRYLLSSTDNRLQAVITETQPRLAMLLPPQVSGHGQPSGSAEHQPAYFTVPGEYYVAYQPHHGPPLTLENAAGIVAYTPLITVETPATHLRAWTSVQYSIRMVAAPAPGGYLVAGASLAQVDGTVEQATWIVVLGSLAVVLLIGLGVFAVLRRGLRPIESMAAQADRISAGDLTDRVDLPRPGSEVGRLGTALNGMLTRIEVFVAERESGQELMRRFFADASHELRSPLASLRANAELYQQGAVVERAEVDEVMRRMTLETQRMSRLVDDMLRLARLGRHPGQRHESVDLTSLAHGCVERAEIAEPDRRFRADIAEDLVIAGDEELLSRALDNLLGNVRTHAPAGAAASITVAGHEDTITIEVSDDGPGVAPDDLPRLFDRFYRAKGPERRPGSGLGLAIVREIAAAHGGTVEATANEPHGLRVTIELPW